MSELAFLFLLFGLPAAIGFYLAKRRGKNPFLWGLLSGIFPFFLILLKMKHKPLDKNNEPFR